MIVNEFPDVVMLFVGTTAGVYFVCYLSRLLEDTIFGTALAYCGRESFYLMAMHIMFMRMLALLFSKCPVCGISIDDFTYNTTFIGFCILFFGSIGCTLCSLIAFRKIKTIFFSL